MDRVLLALDRESNRELVAEWLSGIYDILLPTSDQDIQRPFDLGIIDGPALDRLWEAVRERRRREQPVILPFLLVTPRPDVRLITRHIWTTIDELIVSPVEKLELHIRVEILLRGRRLSLALRDEVEAAERERRRAEAALESRARLIHGLTHDLKNPLGAIRGFAGMLLGEVPGELNAQQRNWIQRILGATSGTLRLLDDLLELFRAESGRLPLHPEPTEVASLLRDVSDDHRATAEAEGLVLEVDASPGLPTVNTDPHRVRQILGNLLSNALKYTPDGGRVRLRARKVDEAAGPRPSPALVIEVSDTGPGIPRKEQERIFHEFSRLEAANGPRGAGLGLAISRTVARTLGGDLTVQSEPGRGATFELWLPTDGLRPDKPVAPEDR
jgi:signal transduction histidine kinase